MLFVFQIVFSFFYFCYISVCARVHDACSLLVLSMLMMTRMWTLLDDG